MIRWFNVSVTPAASQQTSISMTLRARAYLSPEPFSPGTFLLSLCSRPASAQPRGKMAAPTNEEDAALEPGAAPYGNFPNYSRFHPPEGRLRLLPGGLLRRLFPSDARPLLGLDVGCNSGVRAPWGGVSPVGPPGGREEGWRTDRRTWG